MNQCVVDNFAKLRPTLFLLPVAILLVVLGFLFTNNALNPNAYVEIQSDVFFTLNAKLSQYPTLQDNLTQMGNAMIFMSLLAILIIYAPQMWSALLLASIISGIVSRTGTSSRSYYSFSKIAASQGPRTRSEPPS